jgi:hypothetical protein
MSFRRALDRGNVTDALSAAAELQFIGLAEALELTLLLANADQDKYERAAVRWRVRFVYESKNVGIRESQAVLALLAAIPVNALAATALAELLSRRRGFERPCETLVMTASEWDWTLRVFDHVDLNASDYSASVLRDGSIAARNPEDRRARAGNVEFGLD